MVPGQDEPGPAGCGEGLTAAKNGCTKCLFLQWYKSRDIDKTQGSNSFVCSCNVNIGIDVVSRSWLNFLCRLVQSQKRQFLILSKGCKKKSAEKVCFIFPPALPLRPKPLRTTAAWLHFLDCKQTSHVNLKKTHKTKTKPNPKIPTSGRVGKLLLMSS